MKLLDGLTTKNDFSFFRTDKARQKNSNARRLVGAALTGFRNFKDHYPPKILCLAIILGDSTLEHFSKLTRDKEDIETKKLCSKVQATLQKFFGFNDDYAKWLPNNLEHLSRGSIDILKDLNPEHFDHVRYSTVVRFKNEKEMNQFMLNISAIIKLAGRPKRTILENAVFESNKEG